MSTVRIGDVEIQPILDADVLMDPNVLFPQHAEQMLTEYAHLADERKLMSMRIATFAIRSNGKTYLVDTGLGSRKRPGFPGGNLDQSLKGLDMDPGDIDVVVHTHLHVDHVGWNTVDGEDGKPRVFFPNARFAIQQTEWDFWMVPEKVSENPHLEQCVEPLRNSGRIDFHDGEEALDEHLTFISTPGHTPGHVSIGVMSQGERAVIIGDASHHPAQLDHPDWSPTFDIEPERAAKTRAALFDRVEQSGETFIGGHWPEPAIGRIVRLDGKRHFKAL